MYDVDKEECRNCEGMFFLERKIERLQQQLKIYKYDYLTGLPGRIDFENNFDNFMNDFEMFGKTFTLCIVDINDLHLINRKHGYKHGDNRILEVSKNLERILPSCSIYRIGGDEFSILTRSTTPNDLCKAITESNIVDFVSVGCSQPDTNCRDKSILFKKVDDLVIEDKQRKKVGRINKSTKIKSLDISN